MKLMLQFGWSRSAIFLTSSFVVLIVILPLCLFCWRKRSLLRTNIEQDISPQLSETSQITPKNVSTKVIPGHGEYSATSTSNLQIPQKYRDYDVSMELPSSYIIINKVE